MKTAILAGTLALIVSGCVADMDREEYAPERLERDVALAMCSTDPAERADAIARVSNKSEGYELTAVSDVVSEIADKIAEKGCPAPAA